MPRGQAPWLILGHALNNAMATLVQAVRLALHYGEEHLGVTDIFGEDVGPPLGGVFTATQGLKTAWNSPLDERGIIGTAMGIAYAGGRPVVRDPVLRLRLQHHRPAEGRRQPALGRRRQLRHADGAS